MINANKKWWVLTGVSIVSFLGCIDLTIVNTAAPAIGRELGASVTQLQLVVNIFVVALSMFMVTAGRLSDIIGRRTILYIGAALFGLASLGAGFAPNTAMLMVFRFIQGAACAVLYTSSSTIVAGAFPDSQRGKAIGALFAVNGIGLAVGPMLGGVLVSALSWHWVFLINVPLVVIALIICAFSLDESPAEDNDVKLDWPGLVLIGLCLSGLIFGLIFNDTFGWGSWQVLGALTVGVAALLLFVVAERRAKYPIIPLNLFGNRVFLSAVTAEFSLAFFYALALFLMPLYLSLVRHYDELTIGLMMLPTTTVVAILSPLVGRLADKAGPKTMLVIGFSAFVISALLQSQLKADSGIAYIAIAFAFMGIGWACVLGPAAIVALSSVPKRMSGLAVGSTWTFHNFGGAVGLAIGMTLFRVFADSFLRNQLTVQGVQPGSWTTTAVTNLDTASQLVQHNTHVSKQTADELVGALFTSGDSAAMLLLVGTSLAALVTILLLGQRKTAKDTEIPAPAESAVTTTV